MKTLLLAGGISLATIVGVDTELKHTNFTAAELADKQPDSVHVSEIQRIVKNELLSRLQGQGGLTTEWAHMDKSGHRDMVFTNAITQIKQANKDALETMDFWANFEVPPTINYGNGWAQLDNNNELHGEIVRYDGSHRSHVCSFKIEYPDRQIQVRRSALDEWEDVVAFTGVKHAPSLRQDREKIKQ